jgi:hypothetical protein
VELRFSGTQKAYRFLRLERASDGGIPPQGRAYLYRGYVQVPFQCWNAEDGVQFEAAFVERCLTADDGTILPPAQQPATFDSTWAPNATAGDGGHEYLMVVPRAYAGVPKPEIGYDGSLTDHSQPLLYALWCQLRANFDRFDALDLFEFRYALPPAGSGCATARAREPLARRPGRPRRVRVHPRLPRRVESWRLAHERV